MKSLTFTQEDNLEIFIDGGMVYLTSDPIYQDQATIKFSVLRLPAIIAYLKMCLQESKRREQTEA